MLRFIRTKLHDDHSTNEFSSAPEAIGFSRQEYTNQDETLIMMIIGVDRKKKPVENGLIVRRYCSNCRCECELKEYRVQRYFALFFIPLIPIDKGESLLRCAGCGHLYRIHDDDYAVTDGANGPCPVIMIPCIYCQKMISVTVTGKPAVVECLRCGSTFELGRDNRS